MKYNDAFCRDAGSAIADIRGEIRALSASPGAGSGLEKLLYELEILSGMFSIFSLQSISYVINMIIGYAARDIRENKINRAAVYETADLFLSDLNGLIGGDGASDGDIEALSEKYQALFGEPGKASGNNGISGGPPPASEENTLVLPAWDRGGVDGEVLEIFIEEALEIFTSLDKSLIELEVNPENDELINQIFRNMHTLKGNSAAINLKIVNLISHRAESILDRVRKKALPLSSGIIDVMLESTSILKSAVERIRNNGDPNTDITGILGALDGIIKGRPEAPAGPDAPGAPFAPAGGAAKKAVQKSAGKPDGRKNEASSLRVDISKLDKVMNLVGEIVIEKIRIIKKIKDLNELISLINDLIAVLEEETSGRSFEKGIYLDIRDDINEKFGGFAMDADFCRIYRNEVEALREIIEKLRDKRPDHGEKKLWSGSDNKAGELRRIARIFKEAINELSVLIERLNLITKELQEGIIQMRMVPVSQLFDTVPRLVRGLSKELGKKVRLEIRGEETELDKSVIEKLCDPMMHIIRNAIDHGIEEPEARLLKGKAAEGTIILNAQHKGNQVLITVEDDGKGMDDGAILQKAVAMGIVSPDRAQTIGREEILNFIFLPGFSSADKITSVSGRGVGMDVVLNNIKKLKGSVEVDSVPGRSSRITIILPLTLAIIQVLLIKCSNQVFALPLNFIGRYYAGGAAKGFQPQGGDRLSREFKRYPRAEPGGGYREELLEDRDHKCRG